MRLKLASKFKFMKLYIFTFTTILLLSFVCFGQKTGKRTKPPKPPINNTSKLELSENDQGCNLTLLNSPTIRGLKLGMTKETFINMAPSDLVVTGDTLLFKGDLDKETNFKNILFVEGKFFEEKLYDLRISYWMDSAKWKSNQDFAKNISENLNLPYTMWVHNYSSSDISCKGFSIKVWSIPPNIQLTDENVIKAKKATEDKAIKEKNDAFKP